MTYQASDRHSSMSPIKSINRSIAAGRRRERHFALNPEIKEILDGLIISDGHIYRGAYSSVLTISSKHLEFIKHLSSIFKKNNIEHRITESFVRKYQKSYYTISTLSYPELNDFHERWYPAEKKIIPADIEISNLFMLYWYLGDGKNASYTLEFGTYAFNLSDIKQICWKICEYYSYYPTEVRIYMLKGGPIINLAKSVTDNFLGHIGPSPVTCFDYKFIHDKSTRGRGNILLENRWLNERA